ncbi:MAG: oxidoreductase [Variovorax sp.]|nr:oxidoreductase [Variovorax sp.]
MSTTQDALIQVRVRAVTYEADGILGFELVPMPPLKELPAFSAGSHIDLHLPNGLLRSYSLLNAPTERHRYLIGVNKDAKSRGGSRYMHEVLRSGDTLTISAPRNNFPLDESSPLNVFIAGGIGITPVMSMIARSQALGTPWRLHYAARTRRNAAFLDALQGFHNQPNVQLSFNFDQEAGGQMLDIAGIVHALPPGAHVYCCGPLPMLDAYEQATAALPPERVHMEYFAAKEAAATDGGYTVELARSGKQVEVRAGQTILDSLLAIGIEPPFSCQEGICGTCEVRVLEGIPDHRDLVLSNAEKAANDRIMICCSGCKTQKLVLDL